MGWTVHGVSARGLFCRTRIGEGLAFRPISCLTLSLLDGDFTQGPHIDSGLTDYKSGEKLT